jgi:hypothetical protein
MAQEVFVGIDVAKGWLDVYHPGRGARRIDNTPAAARDFAAACARQSVWIVFEASGGYGASEAFLRRVRATSDARRAAGKTCGPRGAGARPPDICEHLIVSEERLQQRRVLMTNARVTTLSRSRCTIPLVYSPTRHIDVYQLTIMQPLSSWGESGATTSRRACAGGRVSASGLPIAGECSRRKRSPLWRRRCFPGLILCRHGAGWHRLPPPGIEASRIRD